MALSLALCAGCRLPRGATQDETPTQPAAKPEKDSDVVVNGVLLSEGEVAAFEQSHGLRIPPGGYWYDGETGAWGLAGGATEGFTRIGLAFRATLRADA